MLVLLYIFHEYLFLKILNRKFNDKGNRAFMTTQSVNKLKMHLKDWALSVDNWKLVNDSKEYNISEIDEVLYANDTSYKERWINENGLE